MKLLPLALLVLAAALLAVAVPARAQDLFVVNVGSQAVVRITPDGKASVFTTIKGGMPMAVLYNPRLGLCVAVTNLEGKPPEAMVQTFSLSGVRTRTFHTEIGVVGALAGDKENNLYAVGIGNAATVNSVEPSRPRRETIVTKIAPDGSIRLVFHSPSIRIENLAVDDKGSLFVADRIKRTILKITPDGKQSVFARLEDLLPFHLMFDGANNLYVGLADPIIIKKYTPTGVGTVFAEVKLESPAGMAFDPAGDLYVADMGKGNIVKFTPDGKTSVFAHENLNSPLSLAFGPAPAR